MFCLFHAAGVERMRVDFWSLTNRPSCYSETFSNVKMALFRCASVATSVSYGLTEFLSFAQAFLYNAFFLFYGCPLSFWAS